MSVPLIDKALTFAKAAYQDDKTPFLVLMGALVVLGIEGASPARSLYIPWGPTGRAMGLPGALEGLKDLNEVFLSDPLGLKSLSWSDTQPAAIKPLISTPANNKPDQPSVTVPHAPTHKPVPIYRLDHKAVGARYTLQHPAKQTP